MNTRARIIFISIISSLLLFLGVNAWAELPPEANGQPLPSLAPMLTKVLPTIVNVSVKGFIPAVPNPFSDEAGGNDQNNQDQNNSQSNPGKQGPYTQGPRKFISLGSGVIIDAGKGYIVTNAHVVSDASIITVTLKDGRQYIAKIIGKDPSTDIAVLQINAKDLQQITFADSSKLNVGDFVVAIGNPFGLNQTVTSGIVSGLQRTHLGIKGFENFIQTDAPINPGNSGGALVNLAGQLIGINTAILAPDGGNIGIGFAIPSDMVKSIAAQLIEYGSVHRGLMGVMVQTLSPGLAQAFNLPNNDGAVVTLVTPNSPAAKAGFKTYDVITEVNGEPIHDATEITNIIGLTRVGSRIDVSILRQGKPMKLSVVTASPNSYRADSRKQNPFLYGINLRNFSQLNAIFGQVNGVQILAMAEDAPARYAIPTGLIPGDVIISANEQPITDVDQLQNIAAQSAREHKYLLLNVLRGGGAMFVLIK